MTDRICVRYSNLEAPDEPAPLPGQINPIPEQPVTDGDVIEVDAYLADDVEAWVGFDLADE